LGALLALRALRPFLALLALRSHHPSRARRTFFSLRATWTVGAGRRVVALLDSDFGAPALIKLLSHALQVLLQVVLRLQDRVELLHLLGADLGVARLNWILPGGSHLQ
jgi:hypothetical protein